MKKVQKYLKVVAICAMFLILFSYLIGCCSFSGSVYEGEASAHFDGEEFFNQERGDRSFWDMIKWMFNRNAGKWEDWTEVPFGAPPPERIFDINLRATLINHSTVLIQTEGMNILTDPVWSDRVTPVSFIGPKRKIPPGIKFDDLPPIDIVLISHNHYDHLDIPTLENLKIKFNPIFIVSLGNKYFMLKNGFKNVVELDWWQEKTINNRMKIVFVPARHFSMRGICDNNKTLWGGFVILTSGGPIYFAGDTGFGSHFQQIFEKFGPIRFSMLPVGAYKPRWFMEPNHCSPEDAARAHKILESQISIPIHFGTFAQGDDGQTEPIDTLKFVLNQEKISTDKFIVPTTGVGILIPCFQK